MRILVVAALFVLTIAVFIVLKVVTANAGLDVKARFVERTDTIPSRVSKMAWLNGESFAHWLDDPQNKQAIHTYAFPVLFPLDFLFLILLGVLLGYGSVTAASSITFLRNVPLWIWWVFPSLYILCDFVEDAVLVALFSSSISLREVPFFVLHAVTQAKIATVSIAFAQATFLMLFIPLLRFFPPAPV